MKSFFITSSLLVSLVLLPFAAGAVASAAAAPELLPSDCQKCHSSQIAEIEAAGGQHRDAIGCTDCHQEHPPRGANAIPECSLCHESGGNPHFSSPDCLNCHRPHSPLNIDFARASQVRPACMTCHPNQGQELLNYPSNHSVLDSKECHQQHGQFLTCLECHEPHQDSQSYANCLECHRPHMPLKVAYDNNVPVSFCASCHPGPAVLLSENRTKHHQFNCVYCHKFQHKVIPKCRTCHGQPHFDELHETYPQCIHCHIGPHNLVN